MTYSSCVIHPPFEIQITIREWQVKKCKQKAGPMLLNLFEKTHTRLLHEYVRAQENGVKPEELNKMLWQNWTEPQLEKMLLNQHKRDSIRSARIELESFNFIKVGENPFGKKSDRSLWIRFLAHNVTAYTTKYIKEKFPNQNLPVNGVKEKTEKTKLPVVDKFTPDIDEIFENWKRIFDKPSTKLTESKARKVRARLKEGFSKTYIIEACEGCRLSEWHVEHIEFDIAKICRDSTNLEKHHVRFERSGKVSSVMVKDSDKPFYQNCADFIIQKVFLEKIPVEDVKKLFDEPTKTAVKNGEYLSEVCIQMMNQETILNESQKQKIKDVCFRFVIS